MIGHFDVDDGTSYQSMELPLTFDGEENVPDKTCIPAGTYKIINDFSPRHDCMKPRLVGVSDRIAIEIDEASKPSDLLGCTAIGYHLVNPNPRSASDVVINGSDAAYADFYLKFLSAIAAGEIVTISYFNDF